MSGNHISVFIQSITGGVGKIGDEGACETSADDIGGVHDEKESVRVHFFDKMAKFRDLMKIDDGKDDFLVFSAESALPV